MYADDSAAIAMQDKDFRTVERKLTYCTLTKMVEYFEITSIRPNPTKTKIFALSN